MSRVYYCDQASEQFEGKKRVQVHYTGRSDGVVFDSSEGREPLQFVVGKWNISQMRASTFCLAVTSGVYSNSSSRLLDSILHGLH